MGQVLTKPPELTDRQRAVLTAVAGKYPDSVSLAYVRLVTSEDAWATVHQTAMSLKSLGLVELVLAGTQVRVTAAGRELLGGEK